MEGQNFDNKSFKSISSVPQIYLNDRRQSLLSVETTSAISLLTNDYQDYDNFSFGSTRSNSVATLQVNEKPKTQSSSFLKWMDWLYSLFQKPEEKETEDIDDDITYDESQMRIILIGVFLATALALVASTNVGVLLVNSAQPSQIVLDYVPPEPEVLYRTPHIALLFSNGLMNVYDFSTFGHLKLDWNFTVQKTKATDDAPGLLTSWGHYGVKGQYFAFAKKDELHVIYGDMKKVNSVIKSKTNHFTIPNKNILRDKVFAKSGYFRVGDYLWVFGGYYESSAVGPVNGHGANIYEYNDQQQTMLWHIKKQRWLWGPEIPCFDSDCFAELWETGDFPVYYPNDFITQNNCLDPHDPTCFGCFDTSTFDAFIHKGSTGLAINRNVGAIFFINHGKCNRQNCLVALVYDFTNHIWLKKDGCFYKLEYKAMSDGSIMLRSTSYFNKNKELRVILWFMYNDGFWEETQIGLLDLDSSLENIQFHTLPSTPGYQQSTTLFTSMGIVYLITATYQPSQLAIQTWNNLSMSTIQTINISQELSKSLDRKPEDGYDSNFMLSVPFSN